MSIKRAILLCLACLSIGWCFATEILNMFIDTNRFLAKDRSTVLLVDYQVPYRNMVFMANDKGYMAELNVSVEFLHGDSISIRQDVTDKIGISNKADAGSKQKSYLNRLSFVLDNSATQGRFTATDINSQKTFTWQFPLAKLSPNTILSDLELDSEVKPDTLQYLAKFHRDKVLYRPEPSILVNRTENDYVYLFLEAYHHEITPDVTNLLNLSLEKDSLVVMDEYIDYQPKKPIESFSLKIPLAGLAVGKHSGTVTLQSGEISESREFEIFLVEDREDVVFLFADSDEEYALMRYFLGNKLPADWKDFTVDKKRRFATRFWQNMAISTKLDIPAVLKLVQERVDYANRYYSNLVPGWKTDIGRIYIRYGAPDDVDKDISSDKSRFARKDYQIWKYRSGEKPVYIFVDVQMNGNYKLIYADNDDLENSDPVWKRYVGTDFDESRLDN